MRHQLLTNMTTAEEGACVRYTKQATPLRSLYEADGACVRYTKQAEPTLMLSSSQMSKTTFQDDKHHTERSLCGPRVLEGQKGDVCWKNDVIEIITSDQSNRECLIVDASGPVIDQLIARDLGLVALAKDDGVDQLVVKMREHVFPSLEDEAQLLYHHGQKPDGILARQSGGDDVFICLSTPPLVGHAEAAGRQDGYQ